jgi:hypothetical protein
METLYIFLLGVLSTSAAAIGVFFWRFWRASRDRLFLAFAVGFWLIAGNWAAVAAMPTGESWYQVYLMRLAAFAFIIWGIVEKNLRRAGA